MIFLSSHSYLHIFNYVRFGSVVELRLIADTHQLFQHVSVAGFEFHEVRVQCSVGSLHLLDGFDFSPLQEEQPIKLRLQNVQVLKDSFCN
jgi:hypothetical protein